MQMVGLPARVRNWSGPGGPAFGRTAWGEKGEIALVPPREDRHAGRCKATSGLRKGTPTGGREQPQAIEGGERGREGKLEEL